MSTKVVQEIKELIEVLRTLLNQEAIQITRERCWIELQTTDPNIYEKQRLSIQRQLEPPLYRMFFREVKKNSIVNQNKLKMRY